MIDQARGIALIAMAIFHFNFDLELLGLKPPGYINQPHWVYFARSIASSFLFLVGIALVLAHHDRIRWQKFGLRALKLGLAALAITVATYFATPNIFIFFGILHNILVSSLLGLAFLRAPWPVTLVSAICFLFTRSYLQTPLLDAPIWWWSGLSKIIPTSSDYVPLFPWFGCVLLGIATAQLATKSNLSQRLALVQPDGPLAGSLQFLGRHSLLFYLLHQPVLIGILLLYLQFLKA